MSAVLYLDTSAVLRAVRGSASSRAGRAAHVDALHLATYSLARRHLGEDLTLLTVDRRLEAAADSI